MEPMVRLLVEGIAPAKGRGYWHAGPSAAGSLRGVSVDQALWRPARGRKCLWEIALHIAYWDYAVRCQLEEDADRGFPRSPANWPALPTDPTAEAWRNDCALLRAEHRKLTETASRIQPRRFGQRPRGAKKWTYGELILGIGQHDAYHTGQIQLLKRLWPGANK